MAQNLTNQPTQDTQYFPEYSFKENNEFKQKTESMWVKIRYWAWQAWPTIKNLMTFLFYWAYRAVKGILTTAKDEIRPK